MTIAQMEETEQMDMEASFSPVSELIDEARAGRMVILVGEAAENGRGVLLIPSECADHAVVNFMATHARGLICMTLTAARADELGLELMPARNRRSDRAAFTQSIEARDGISTGISAQDRALTIRLAHDPACGPENIVTPGHVFPIRATDGGVLARASTTEASIDICRLAGRIPSATTCEIISDAGALAGLDDLKRFAARHGVKIGRVADLVSFRLRHDGVLEDLEDREVVSRWGGKWRLRVFRDPGTGYRHYAMTKGDLSDGAEAVTVHVHRSMPADDIMGFGDPDLLTPARAMLRIAEEGRGVFVMLQDAGPATGTDDPLHLCQGPCTEMLAALGLSRVSVVTPSGARQVLGLEEIGTAAGRQDQHV
jgi:3,4-dihydroxy 2-butanone 4-phosphate synthase/GTP cyclohydrolase II